MTIPKTVHYCWFGNAEMPNSLKECMTSWQSILPDFEFIRWDESSFVPSNKFVKEAFRRKKWAIVSDVARLEALYKLGGVYLDTDMLLLKRFDDLMEEQFFIGAENEKNIGFGIIGVIREHYIIKEMLDAYQGLEFDDTFFPTISSLATTIIRQRTNYVNKWERIRLNDLLILPPNYFYAFPLQYADSHTFHEFVDSNSIAVHLWFRSWHSEFGKLYLHQWEAAFFQIKQQIKEGNKSYKYYIKLMYYLSGFSRLRYSIRSYTDQLTAFLLRNYAISNFILQNKLLSISSTKRIISQTNIFPQKKEEIIERSGFVFQVDLNDHIGWGIFTNLFKPSIDALLGYVSSQDVVFDIGANQGYYCINLSRKTQGVVYAFEPCMTNYNRLMQNIAHNNINNIRTVNAALGSEKASSFLQKLVKNNSGMIRLSDTGEEACKVDTLDDFVRDNKLGNVNFIKIDVEGSELEVLKGGQDTIRKFKPKIWIEVNDVMLREMGTSAKELLSWIEDCGYIMFSFNHQREIRSKFHFDNCFMDVLCISKTT